MEIFLEKVANDLLEKNGENIHNLTIVFPNRRAGVFFINYLNKLVKQPLISPEITTITELFTNVSPYFIPDKLNLALRLYKVYRDLTGTNESFDDFYYWGGMLISDFDQVDKYLADAKDLFTNITELKEIDRRFSLIQPEEREVLENFWKTILVADRSANQDEFVRLWQDLARVYEEFKAALHSEGLAYEGMLYSSVIEEISANSNKSLTEKQYVFVGFNALNKCEEVLFDHLQGAGMAVFYWDYDNYYIDDPEHEAGLFMRKNLKNFPQAASDISVDAMRGKTKSMKIVNITSQVGQAQVAGEELSRLLKKDGNIGFDETAVVLCDEELLLPVISALPEQAGNVNITMGFPMNLTTVFGLVKQLADLQKKVKKDSAGIYFYNKDVLDILNHQLVLSLGTKDCKDLSASIKANNLVYVPGDELSKNKLLSLIFSSPGNLSELADYFLEILKYIFLLEEKKGKGESNVLFREYLYEAYLAVNQLKQTLVTEGTKILGKDDYISFNTFFRLLNQYLGELIITFEGEPVEGLQVMGILETRALDFKNLILLSLNDGVMPKIAVSGSFIPYNLRRVFGLPTIEEQNAIYAYYFYRLLQRTEDVTFVYNSSANGLTTGEKSRYLYQLQLLSPLIVPETTVVYQMERVIGQSFSINKDEKVISSMKKFFGGETILSPTALDKYLNCSLQFYFRYVAGLKEPDEISDEIDLKVFGLLFHKSMESIYRPYVGKLIEKETLDCILKDTELINRIILDAFHAEYFKGIKDAGKIKLSGKNWLIFEILRKYIIQLLELDKKRAPFSIEGLEMPVRLIVPINDSQRILIGGIIDRIDRLNNTLQILDYKTGKAELSFPMLDSLFERENKNRNKAAFQTLVYSYILHKNRPGEKSIYPGIYNLRSIFEGDFDAGLKSKENGNKQVEFTSISERFEKLLINLLNEIFDPNTSFEKTAIEENCAYCAYKRICGN